MTPKSSAKNTRFSKSRLAFAIAAHMFAAGNAVAGPSGGEVVGGVGSINQQGSETTITQTTDRMAIDWQSFDVGKDERVTFIQPGQSAVALNRILSNNGSEILGQIDANGHVILVNPHGVVFGEGAVVNAGGLIASGLQINPDDFMNGDLVFKRIEGTDGTVINAGMINAASGGNVALIGTQVENRGLISARLGSVILASGKEAVLTFDESGLLGVQVDEAILQSELGDKAAITNSGELKAEGGRILLSASTTRDVFSQAVNWGDQKQARSVTYNEDGSFTLGAGGDVVNTGEITVSGETAGNIVALGENITSTGKIRADATQEFGGNVELHSNTTTIISEQGIVTANAEQGGDIKILGKNVGLFDSSSVEATGENGGGRILVGGDREGLNHQIRNADFVYINEKASINASATNAGDGGRAIVFAEDTARIHGNLSARGGESEGNGGFVETSGKKSFSITASPDVSAVNGVAGHWLIDPYSITVSDSGNGVLTGGVFESGSEAGSTISPEIISDALGKGASVTLKTGDDGRDEGGNISIDSPIIVKNGEGDVTLRLDADKNIAINEGIVAEKSWKQKLNIDLHAGENITIAEGVEVRTSGGDFVVGSFVGNDVAVGAKSVNFKKNAAVDVTGQHQHPADHYDNPMGSYDGLEPGGRILIGADENINIAKLVIKGRDRLDKDNDDLYKIVIFSKGGDITFSQGFVFDNNPTEVFFQGEDPNNGYSTISLNAGGAIKIERYNDSGAIVAGPEDGDRRPEHQDRLRVIVRAGENIDIEGSVQTKGGDFKVLGAEAVSFKGRVLDASSLVGDKNYFGDITLDADKLHFSNSDSPYVIKGRNLDLIVEEELVLPSINAEEKLLVNASAKVSQMENSKVDVKGDVSLAANKADVKLNAKDNVFGGSVWVEEAGVVEIASNRTLNLGRDKEVMSVGSLKVTSEGSIEQIGAIKVEGESEFSANENVTLSNPQNQFTSFAIAKAKIAEINNSQNLTLVGVKAEDKLDISVVGNLEQLSAIEVGQLVLDVSGETELKNSNNKIARLSGKIADGEIVVSDDSLQGGNFLSVNLAVSGEAVIKARQVDAGDVLLSGGAALTFNDVGTFTLSHGIVGEDALVNSVTVSGRRSDGTYTIAESASWDHVKLIFDGAGNTGETGDALVVMKEGVTVGLADGAISNEPLALVALNIENIEAKNRSSSTLIGASLSPDGYEWIIDGGNKGVVTDLNTRQQIKFTNFDVLVGGSKNDLFKMNNLESIAEIRGGGGEDTLDYSDWRGALKIALGDESLGVAAEGKESSSEIKEIETLVGNGANATLQAPSVANTWHISNAQNNIVQSVFKRQVDEESPVEEELREINFRDFGTLLGGASEDTFLVNLDSKAAQYTLNGGSGGRDTLEFSGDGEGWQGAYNIDDGNPSFSFTSPTDISANFTYVGIESIKLNTNLDLMTLTGSPGTEFVLGPQYWQVNGETPEISFSEMKKLRVEADDSDIHLTGMINLPGSLELLGGDLTFDADTLLKINHLHLQNLQGDVGSREARLNISVETLMLDNNEGDLYLSEVNGVELSGLLGAKLVDLRVESGDLSQRDAIVKESGELLLHTVTGSIWLDHDDNNISVPVTLAAGARATLHSDGDLQLAKVDAQDLMVRVGGGIESTGPINVYGKARFESEGNIEMGATINHLNEVAFQSNGDVAVASQGRISIYESSIGGGLTLKSPEIYFSGLTSAGTLTIGRVADLGEALNPEGIKIVTVVVGSPVLIDDVAEFNDALVIGAELVNSASGKVFGVRKFTPADQMIEIEGLAEIDPAIFTNVKNYFYQDVSIRLPSDQIYEESMEGAAF